MTLLNNSAIQKAQVGTTPRPKLSDDGWCVLVKQLSELDVVDFEALVMAVRLRGRFEETDRAGGRDGAPNC